MRNNGGILLIPYTFSRLVSRNTQEISYLLSNKVHDCPSDAQRLRRRLGLISRRIGPRCVTATHQSSSLPNAVLYLLLQLQRIPLDQLVLSFYDWFVSRGIFQSFCEIAVLKPANKKREALILTRRM
jgi:hypothetical protein